MSDIKDKWIWPFELVEKIGEGGMGVVYRARYVKNDRNVAVKILPDDVSDPTILGRFDRELEILRKLRHPNIVHCFGGTTEGKHRFYAMEIVEGGSFDKLLARRAPLPWEMVVKYAQQMTAALEYAHANEVTHRDVKPGNFLIGTNGQLKLSDFGLATFAAARNLTAAGKTMGTFRYMAPEQIRGKDVGPRSDLYSLGCVIYEMVTGKPPFDGATPAEILDQHLHKEAPRAAATALDCPTSLDRLISQLLKKDPNQRPESAAETSRMLAEISPVLMVNTTNTSPIQSVRTTAETEVPSEAKRPSPLWNAPVWVGIMLIMIPLLLAMWTVSLSRQAANAAVAFATWEEAWESTDPNVKRVAAKSLGTLSLHNERALSLLAENLDDESPQLREISLYGLEHAGATARAYLTQIKRMHQQDPEPNVRNQADSTIQAIEQGESPSSGSAMLVLILVGTLSIAGYLFARKKFGST